MRKLLTFTAFVLFALQISAQYKVDELNLLILKNKYQEALNLSQELIAESPDNAKYYYSKALVCKLMYKYSQAIKSIQKAIELDAVNTDYLAEYAFLLQKTEKNTKAIVVFEQVIKLNPYHLNVGVTLSSIYLKERKYEKAENILLDLYSQDTLNGFLARKIGINGYLQGNSKKAKKWLQRAIELDSTDINAYKYLFSVYAAKEEFELAFQIMDKAKSIDPNNKALYIMAGDAHVMRNHNYRAIPEYLKAFDLDSEDEDVPRKLGLCYYKTKNYEKAKHYLLIADKLSMHMEVYKYLGIIYKMYNEPESSNSYYTKALDILKPDNNTIFDIYIDVAENHVFLEKHKEAINWYKKALNLELDGVWSIADKNKALVDLASVYSDKLDNKKMAIEYLTEVKENKFVFVNGKDYHTYAQQQIAKLKEDLFFEGDL